MQILLVNSLNCNHSISRTILFLELFIYGGPFEFYFDMGMKAMAYIYMH